MALVKIYAVPEKHEELVREVASTIKLVTAAALNVPEVPTTPNSVETVYVEGIDLIGIDYILEIIAVKRPNQQAIADNIISGLNRIYADKLFSVYFNNILEEGMANTPRQSDTGEPISMDEAVNISKKRGAP